MKAVRRRHAMAAGAGLAAVLWAGNIIAPAAVAAEYSWQVSGSYRDLDADAGVETSRSSVRATYYLTSVDDRVGPYELAPFLNRSSHVAVSRGRTKLRERQVPALFTYGTWNSFQSPDGAVEPVPIDVFGSPSIGSPTEFGIDSSEYEVDGLYVWRGTGWYAGGRVARRNVDVLPVWPITQTISEHESAGVVAGRYFGSRTALELGIGSDAERLEQRVQRFGFDPATGLPLLPGYPDIAIPDLQIGTDTETDYARLSIRHVGQLGDSTFELLASIRSSLSESRLILPPPPNFFRSIGPFDPPEGILVAVDPYSMPGEFFESERERQLRLSGALFPTQTLGVRVTYTETDHDPFGLIDRVGLSANWFLVRKASIEIELVRSTSARRYSGSGTDSLSLRLLGRF